MKTKTEIEKQIVKLLQEKLIETQEKLDKEQSNDTALVNGVKVYENNADRKIAIEAFLKAVDNFKKKNDEFRKYLKEILHTMYSEFHPLLYCVAIERQDKQALEVLVNNYAYIKTHRNYPEFDPLKIAILTGRSDIVQQIMGDLNLTQVRDNEAESLIKIVMNSSLTGDEKVAIIKVLLIRGLDIEDLTPWTTIPNGLDGLFSQLSQHGMQLYNLGTNESTYKPLALLRAAEDLLLLNSSAYQHKPQKFESCLKTLGPCINGRGKGGRTALHNEILAKNKQNILLLLKAGADINLNDYYYMSSKKLALASTDNFIRILFKAIDFSDSVIYLVENDDLTQSLFSNDVKKSEDSKVTADLNAEHKLEIDNLHTKHKSCDTIKNLEHLQLFEDVTHAFKIIAEQEVQIIYNKLLEGITKIANLSVRKSYHDRINEIYVKQKTMNKPENSLETSTNLESIHQPQEKNSYIQNLGHLILGWRASDQIKIEEGEKILKEASEKCPNFDINESFSSMNGVQYLDSPYKFVETLAPQLSLTGHTVQKVVANPLCAAVARQDLDMVQLLLKHNANPNLHANTPKSPLYGAVRLNQIEIVKTLLTAGAKVFNEYLLAAKYSFWPILDLLIEHVPNYYRGWPTDDYSTLLYHAVSTKNIDLVRKITQNERCDLSRIDDNKLSPFHFIAQFWKEETFTESQLEIIECLLKAGGDPNLFRSHKNEKSQPLSLMEALNYIPKTPLMTAILQDNRGAFTAFLAINNIQINKTHQNENRTALLFAICYRESNDPFYIERLLEKRADVLVVDIKHRTALMIARRVKTQALLLAQEILQNDRFLIRSRVFNEEFLKFIQNVIRHSCYDFFLPSSKHAKFHSARLARTIIPDIPDVTLNQPQNGQGQKKLVSEDALTIPAYANLIWKMYDEWQLIKQKNVQSLEKYIQETLWKATPYSKYIKQRKTNQEHRNLKSQIEPYERDLLLLPKQILEQLNGARLEKINELDELIGKLLKESEELNSATFQNERLERRRKQRLNAINRIRKGNKDAIGEPKELGLNLLRKRALKYSKKIIQLQLKFFLKLSGNGTEKLPSIEACSINALDPLFVKTPKKHNKESHLYISGLLNAGNTNRASKLIDKYKNILTIVNKQSEALKTIQEILETKYQNCLTALEDDRKFFYNPKNIKALLPKNASNTKIDNPIQSIKGSETEKRLDEAPGDVIFSIVKSKTPPSSDGLEKSKNSPPAETKQLKEKTKQVNVKPDASLERSTLRELQRAYELYRKANTDPLKNWENQRLALASKIYVKPLQPQTNRKNLAPTPANLARDWQLDTKLKVSAKQHPLRYILETQAKHENEANYWFIENTALLMAITLLMEQAKRLLGGNVLFPNSLARIFRNACLHDNEVLSSLELDTKKLKERNLVLREMANKIDQWMTKEKDNKRSQSPTDEEVLKALDCELLTRICSSKKKEHNYQECRVQLSLCDKARLIFSKERSTIDPNLLSLAENYVTAQASIFYQTIAKHYYSNESIEVECNSWKSFLSQEEFNLLRMQYGDDVDLGKKIRHPNPKKMT